MPTYRDVVKNAEEKLKKIEVEHYAKLLMLELTQNINVDLYASYQEEVPQEVLSCFNQALARLEKEEPLSHILGYSWFYGRKFKVNQDVLIPRNETEELVGHVLADIDTYFSDHEKLTLIDIGTGSGAIAISLKAEESKLQVYASDISTEAVEVAKENAKNNEVDVTFFTGDMVKPFIEANLKVDILLCNPPYIPSEEVLEHSVVGFEPHLALFGGKDGLKYYHTVFEDGPKILNEKAIMAFEIGYDQKDVLLGIVKEYFPNQKAKVLKDYYGNDRMLFVYFNIELKD